jgi:hypothetical protein
VLPFAYASPQAAAMHLCPFCYIETWDEDDLFPYWEKSVPCPRTRRVVPNLVVFLFGSGALCQVCWRTRYRLFDRYAETQYVSHVVYFAVCVEGRLAVRLPSLFGASVGNTEYECERVQKRR